MNSFSQPPIKIVGVIPARMESERLPGKVLLPICGRPMIQRVYEGARGCDGLSELWVATDSKQVEEFCAAHQIPVVMTRAMHQSGTDRICEVMQARPADVYINIQGDEPMVGAHHLELLIEPFLRDQEVQITTLKTILAPNEEHNPNVVKVVTRAGGDALYFSRAAIPYRRNTASPLAYYKHLGFYAYRREALERFPRLPPSPLEQTERLEQLRFLENGIPIHVAETTVDTIGVDTEEDLEAVTRHFEGLLGSRKN